MRLGRLRGCGARDRHPVRPAHPTRLVADADEPAGRRISFTPRPRTPPIPKRRNDAAPQEHESRHAPTAPGPTRTSTGSRPGIVTGPAPVPDPYRPAPAESASTSLNPRERLLEVRSRGLSDDLAGYPAISRVK